MEDFWAPELSVYKLYIPYYEFWFSHSCCTLPLMCWTAIKTMADAPNQNHRIVIPYPSPKLLNAPLTKCSNNWQSLESILLICSLWVGDSFGKLLEFQLPRLLESTNHTRLTIIIPCLLLYFSDLNLLVIYKAVSHTSQMLILLIILTFLLSNKKWNFQLPTLQENIQEPPTDTHTTLALHPSKGGNAYSKHTILKVINVQINGNDLQYTTLELLYEKCHVINHVKIGATIWSLL